MISVRLNNEILSRIVEIEKCREKFSGIKIPLVLSAKLRKNSMRKSSYASTKIEGNPLSESQAQDALAASARHFLKPEQEVRNYYAALEFLDEALKRERPFSKELVLDVQRIVVRGESAEKAGLRGPMPPGVLFAVYDAATGRPDYIPPEAKDVAPLLDELVDYVRDSDDHPILKAAVAHYQLVTIHPFEDGNGRTARLLSGYLLDLFGYGFGNVGSLEEYFAYDIDEYYRSLQMGLPPLFYDGRENPPHPEVWISYFLRMMELYARKAVEVSSAPAAAQLEASLSHLGIKERRFWDYLMKNEVREFTPIEMARTLKVSNRTVINWCAALARNGLVRPLLAGRRIRAYATARTDESPRSSSADAHSPGAR